MLVGYNDWNASAKLISVVNDLSLVYLADSITAMESGIGIVASSPPNRRYLREEKN
jgi:hypothetical protein